MALSRDAMPPGDPIISVRAPRDARRVRAIFPFGLTLELGWDALMEQWSGRFLVPKEVADGVYDVQVIIEDARGGLTHAKVRYTIDSKLDSTTLDVRSVPGGVLVRLTSDEVLREVRALWLDPGAQPISLRMSDDGTCAWAFLPVQAGQHVLRVVASDRARNEQLETRAIDVTADALTQSELEGVEPCR